MLHRFHPVDMNINEGIDGKQQKKRGPKTDSKPALNSKQEKNRQAQRYALSTIVMYPVASMVVWTPAKEFPKHSVD